MKILVIGSEGNIGKRLVPRLESEGHNVFCCDQIQAFRPDYKVVNILNCGDINNIFRYLKPDVVYLLAAMVSRLTCEHSPHITVDTNLGGVNNVIQYCKMYDAKLMYFSTSEVYGNVKGVLYEYQDCHPNNLYGLTKYLGEQLVEYESINGLRYMILRPFMFYDEYETIGDHRSAMIRFVSDLYQKKSIVVHKGAMRSWLHMSDAVKTLTALMWHQDRIVNIGSKDIISVVELAKMICKKLGRDYEGFVEEKPLPEKMTLTKLPDISLQQELVKLEPMISLDEGIDLVINEVRKNDH